MYTAKMIAHSINPDGIDLCTMELTYPLIIHNELWTHRALDKTSSDQFDTWLDFSRSSSSNRAIPSSRIIQQVLDDPFVPRFRYSTTGMTPGDFMSQRHQEEAAFEWLVLRDQAVISVRAMNNMKVAKQWRNRPLGPWQYITTVATANGDMWKHLFSLRNHPAAQDEFHIIAEMAQQKYEASTPQQLAIGEWHLPYVTRDEVVGKALPDDTKLVEQSELEWMKHISMARCARTSYLRQGENHEIRDDLELAYNLRTAKPPHAAPAEHQAQATYRYIRSGNFIGYIQNRQLLGL